jgi:hypothetical protein
MHAHIAPYSMGCTRNTDGAAEKFESAEDDRRRIRRVDGVHDLGGLDGFGSVEHQASEPLFDEAWERRMFRAMIGAINTLATPGGKFRHSIERMDPTHYLSSPYYEHWLTGVSTLAVEAGSPHRRTSNAAPVGAFHSPAPTAVCCPMT